MRVFLIRHGESIQNIKQANGTPDADISLTEKGKRQIELTGKKLKKYLDKKSISLDNARMWVSPYLRTEETANIINKHLNIKEVFQDPRIIEKDFGNFDGIDEERWSELEPLTIKTINKRYASERSRFFTKMPNGESPFDVYNRISNFIETIFRDTNDSVFIVTHGATIKCLIMRWLHKDVKWYYHQLNPDNGAVILIEKDEKDHYIYKTIISNKEDNIYEEI